MVEFGYLFTVLDSNNNTLIFPLLEENMHAAYEKKKNFGEKKQIDFEFFRVTLTWDSLAELENDKTKVEQLYDFFDEALQNMPCTVSIDYYYHPMELDLESGQIISGDINEDTMFVQENFVKRVVDNAVVGTVGYDLMPISDKMSESISIQLNKTYNLVEEDSIELHKRTTTIEESVF